MVVAHPDDDAQEVAAVVALHLADPEFRFFLVHATDRHPCDWQSAARLSFVPC